MPRVAAMKIKVPYPLPVVQRVQAYTVIEQLQALKAKGELKQVHVYITGRTVARLTVIPTEGKAVTYEVIPGGKENEYMQRSFRAMPYAITFVECSHEKKGS
jgi:hypothetical protein